MQITGGHKYFKLRGKMEVNFLDDFVRFVYKSSMNRFLFYTILISTNLFRYMVDYKWS
jgi:hypothetical protein